MTHLFSTTLNTSTHNCLSSDERTIKIKMNEMLHFVFHFTFNSYVLVLGLLFNGHFSQNDVRSDGLCD